MRKTGMRSGSPAKGTACPDGSDALAGAHPVRDPILLDSGKRESRTGCAPTDKRGSPALAVHHAMRHMAGRYVFARRLHIGRRIVEEDIGTEGVEEGPLVASAKEQGLV